MEFVKFLTATLIMLLVFSYNPSHRRAHEYKTPARLQLLNDSIAADSLKDKPEELIQPGNDSLNKDLWNE